MKWFISTCIAGAAGLIVIGIAMYASTNIEDGSGMVASIRRAGLAAMQPKIDNIIQERAARPGEKTDRIQTTSKGLSTKYLIKDNVVEHRNSREFIREKPYIRITASLATLKSDDSSSIPPFNPFDLYADVEPASNAAEHRQRMPSGRNEFVTARILELTAPLPEEDNQELGDDEAERYVAEADAVYAESAAQFRPAIMAGGENEGAETGAGATAAADAASGDAQQAGIPLAPNGERTRRVGHATVAWKKPAEDDDSSDDSELQSVIVKPGDSLISILRSEGTEAWQAQSIHEAINKIPGGLKLRPGQEVRLRVVPGASDPDVKEPLKVSIFTGVRVEATVERNSDGEYALTDKHVEVAKFRREDEEEDAGADRATLYNSVHNTAHSQDLDSALVSKLLRVMAYDVDFKQKVRPGDSFELFFEAKQDDDGTEKAGELLYVAMTVGGETMKYFRYRMPDGTVDFYNDRGSNSRRFLMQTPVKSGRFTSGFGMRRHPLLGIRKMHTGVDWAAALGTPIMAAGNGTIEEAGRKGGNGNYIRIRHGNGYQTAYSHLSRFAPNITKGTKVRQGQLIGYVGSTGYSTGPHLHYEVLVNSRFTNPLKIHVPRSRQLGGRLLADFKKEEQRLDQLMHRTAVKTRMVSVKD